MSYKVGLFAFAAESPRSEIVSELASGVDTMAADLPIREAYAMFAEVGGLVFAHVTAVTSRPLLASRGTLTDMLLFSSLKWAFLGHDDQNGVYLFESANRKAKFRSFLLSDGLGRLGRARAKPNAIDCDATKNAVSIGLHERFGWTRGVEYLQCCDASVGVALMGSIGAEVPLPPGCRTLVSWAPEDDDWQPAGLERRIY